MTDEPHEPLLRVVIILFGLAEVFVGLANLLPGADATITPDLLPVGLGIPAVMALRLLLGAAAAGVALRDHHRLGLATLVVWSLARWVTSVTFMDRRAIEVLLHADPSTDTLALFQTLGQPVLIVGALLALGLVAIYGLSRSQSRR